MSDGELRRDTQTEFCIKQTITRDLTSPRMAQMVPWCVVTDHVLCSTDISAGPDIALKIDDISQCLYCAARSSDRLDRLSPALE